MSTGIASEVTITLQVKSTNEGDQDYTFRLTNTSQASRFMTAISLATAQGLAQTQSLTSGTKFLVTVPTSGSDNLRFTGSTAEAGFALSTAMPGFFPLASTATQSPYFYQSGGGSFLLRLMGL